MARVPSIIHGADHTHGPAIEHVGVDLGGGDVLVPQQFLDGADVVALLQQPRGEAVAEGVCLDRFVDVRFGYRQVEVFAQQGVVDVMAAPNARAGIGADTG